MSTIKVLFFAADPLSAHGLAPRLLLDEDVRQIRKKVRAAEYRDALDFDYRLAARTDDLLAALGEARPQVVHFSGHGGSDGLVLASADGTRARTADAAVLRKLFEVFRGDIRVVVLNACVSLPQAEAIADVVGCAIGTRNPISDEAAILFGASFYRAIAFGRSVQAAYDEACLALALEHVDDRECPVLVARDDVDPSKLVLVAASGTGRGASVTAKAGMPPLDGDTKEERVPNPLAFWPVLTTGARQWAGMGVVAVTLASGAFLLDSYGGSRDPSGDAQESRASVTTLLDPEGARGIKARTHIVPGDLTRAKDLYEAERYATAFPLFRQFADDGNEEAMGYLGVMYLKGEGTDPDKALAEHWLEKALEKARDPRVMHGRGVLHEMNGKFYWAKYWYDAAIEERDYAPAMVSLAEMYAHGRYVKANRDSALALYKKAADAGVVEALIGAGEVYQRGLDGPRDTDMALRLYNQAAEKGSARAMEVIGRMYQEGDGVARDLQAARYWYQKAVDAGSTVAAENIALLNAN